MTRIKELNLRMPVLKMPLVGALIALLAFASMAVSMACGVESGDRRPARQDDSETTEFHRSPVTAFEQFRMDVTKDDTGCSLDPSEVAVTMGNRVRLAVQLPLEEGQMGQGATKSIVVTGEKQSVQFKIEGLQISASGGAFGTGKTEFDLTLESGARKSYDFNAANTGSFDMLCDGAMVGTFTVNPA